MKATQSALQHDEPPRLCMLSCLSCRFVPLEETAGQKESGKASLLLRQARFVHHLFHDGFQFIWIFQRLQPVMASGLFGASGLQFGVRVYT